MRPAFVEEFLKTLDRCARCGKCRTVCPVFNETLDEKMVTRARMVLAEAFLEGSFPPDDELAALWKSCIKCSRCGWVCPSGVKGDEVVMGAAAMLSEYRGSPALRAFFSCVVGNRPLFDSFMFAASRAQRFLPKGERPVLRHLPLAVFGKTEIPELARTPALHSLPRKARPEGRPRLRAALFVGCAMNYVYPASVLSMVDVLVEAGVEVVTPKGQLCCGTPALTMGMAQEARELAEANLRAFREAEADVVVTGCASCALTLRRNYALILGEGVFPRTLEFSELLAELGYEPHFKADVKVNYHDPCHLRFGLGVSEEPRRLLSACAELEATPDEDKCCGGGGSFAFFNPEMSASLARRKVEDARGSDAAALVTACPGCMMQLREHFARAGLHRPVLHLADVLAGRFTER